MSLWPWSALAGTTCSHGVLHYGTQLLNGVPLGAVLPTPLPSLLLLDKVHPVVSHSGARRVTHTTPFNPHNVHMRTMTKEGGKFALDHDDQHPPLFGWEERSKSNLCTLVGHCLPHRALQGVLGIASTSRGPFGEVRVCAQ